MKDTILTNLNTSLLTETLLNDSKDDSIAFLNTLLYSKHDQNANIIRNEIITSFATNNTNLRESLANYNNIITQDKFTNDLILTNTKHQSEISRRKSINFETQQIEEDINDDNDDENISQLKKRLLRGSSSNSQIDQPFDQVLHNEEQKQEDILKDMFQFVKSIKDGAEAFNDKLNQDSNVLKAAEAGLDVTSKKLLNSKKNLNKSIQNLGLIDSLKLFGVVIGLFLLSLIIIKIFPKW